MKTKKLKVDVYDAAMQRLHFIFQNFDNVYVSFSGGKDSGVLLNLALEYIRTRAPHRRIGVFHIDYEAQYTATTEYVDATYAALGDSVDNLRCCIPLKCSTCTSMFETYWRPWDTEMQDLWVRDLPEKYLGAVDLDFIKPTTSDYDFQTAFSGWYHRKQGAKRTAVLVGIRTEESLDRWRTIVAKREGGNFQGRPWTTKIEDGVYNAYPIYDWSVEDIWAANGKMNWAYNRLYDLFQFAGVPIHAQRVASPFHNAAKASLSLYREIDPHMWGKMVSRVNGVNFTASYGGTKAMAWKSVSKPAHFTWKEYAQFLLDTLPAETAANFREKLETSFKFWKARGGVLSPAVIEDLRAAGVDFEVGEATAYKTEKLPVRMDYIDDYTGTDFALVPSWKRVCVTILKNDHVGTYMGFSPTKKEMARREAAIDKWKEL